MQHLQSVRTRFQSETYKDAYSRINAIVIEGEQRLTIITFNWLNCCQTKKMS
jgi:hypothetical protein